MDAKCKTDFARNTATLTITDSVVADSGKYTVDAKNSFGKAASTATLTVKGMNCKTISVILKILENKDNFHVLTVFLFYGDLKILGPFH